ncbi:hypothetical protein [Erwinia amylovora]
MCIRDSSTAAGVVVTRVVNEPVSYTHLDVYKRQLYRCRRGGHAGGQRACLLYTSRCV